MELVFEWNETKARINQQKHDVSFEEAKSIFNDPFLLTFPDPEHSQDEDRYFNIGLSSQLRVLVVIHSEHGETIRLISSRKATTYERNYYEEGI